MAIRRRDIEYLRNVIRAEDRVVADVRQMLDAARSDILAELGRSPSQWRSVYLAELLQRIDATLTSLKPGLQKRLDDAAEEAMTIAFAMTSEIPSLTGIAVGSMVGLDPELLRTLQAYRADRITSVTNALKERVTEIVRRSMLAGRSLVDVERELGSAIANNGAFKTLALRAETVTRTEYGRVLGAAAQAGMETAARSIPKLRKMWVNANMLPGRPLGGRNVRPEHEAAGGQVVPFDQPFIVGGEKLMYPLDPAGSAWNVCNCRCVSVPVVPE